MVENVFKDGFRNDTHVVRGVDGNFLVVSASYTALTINHRPTARWTVSVNLFGPSWTEKDVERAERQRRVLDAGASASLAREVRDALARRAHEWVSVKLP